jgi:hypothetical protein
VDSKSKQTCQLPGSAQMNRRNNIFPPLRSRVMIDVQIYFPCGSRTENQYNV